MQYTRQILEYMATKSNGTATTKQLRKKFKDLTPKQTNQALFVLRKHGKITRVEWGTWKANELTPVNKSDETPAEQTPTPKPKPAVKRKPYDSAKSKEIAHLKKRLDEATQEILHWHKVVKDSEAMRQQFNKMSGDLQDALATIRYLENKLFIAIQHNARIINGNP